MPDRAPGSGRAEVFPLVLSATSYPRQSGPTVSGLSVTHWSFQGRWPETLLAVSGGFWEMMRLCEEPDQVTSSPFWCRMIFV